GEGGDEVTADLEGEPGLPAPTGTGDRDEPDVWPAEQCDELLALAAAADQRVRRRGQIRGLTRRRGGRECRILVQDGTLELLQRAARLESELVDEGPSCRPVRLERLRLPARAVEGDHQLAAQPFPERLLRDERLELADEPCMATKREIGVDPLLEGGETLVLEAGDLGLREELVGELGERRAPPQRERLAEQARRPSGSPRCERVPSLGRQALEAVEVEFAGIDAQDVAGRLRHEYAVRRPRLPVRFEEPPKLGDVVLERRRCRLGRRPRPDLVD